jgi:DNA-binding MarR family transcriptional regulator
MGGSSSIHRRARRWALRWSSTALSKQSYYNCVEDGAVSAEEASVARAEARREPGSLEAEVLAELWAAEGPLTVGQVQEAVGAELAHTTVHTILARLCEKGAVVRERAGRGHAYRAVLAEPDRSAVLARFVADLPPEEETALSEALRRLREQR